MTDRNTELDDRLPSIDQVDAIGRILGREARHGDKVRAVEAAMNWPESDQLAVMVTLGDGRLRHYEVGGDGWLVQEPVDL